MLLGAELSEQAKDTLQPFVLFRAFLQQGILAARAQPAPCNHPSALLSPESSVSPELTSQPAVRRNRQAQALCTRQSSTGWARWATQAPAA